MVAVTVALPLLASTLVASVAHATSGLDTEPHVNVYLALGALILVTIASALGLVSVTWLRIDLLRIATAVAVLGFVAVKTQSSFYLYSFASSSLSEKERVKNLGDEFSPICPCPLRP